MGSHNAQMDFVFSRNGCLRAALLLAALTLTACSTPAAKDFGGRWRPITRLPATTTAIPLNPQYVYFAAPTDITLRTMLARWARDTGLDLSFALASDYTLVQPVAQIRTTDLRSAAEQLNVIYSASQLLISVTDRQILVQPVAAKDPPAASDAPAPQP